MPTLPHARTAIRLLFLCCALGCAVWGMTAPALQLADRIDAKRFDCSFLLRANAGISLRDTVKVLLDWADDADCLRVTITATSITVYALHQRVATLVTAVTQPWTADQPHTVLLLRREKVLAIAIDENLVWQGAVPPAPGRAIRLLADPGWTVTDPRVQILEPVAFADDFMRTADEPGAWHRQRGQWALQSAWDIDPHHLPTPALEAGHAQNPFAWSGHSDTGYALCTTGQSYWEDYAFSVAVCGAADGAVGAAVNLRDADNGLLVRWTPANDRGPAGDRLTISRLTHGSVTLLAEDHGGYLPGQWYRLTLDSTWDGVRVLVDGRERLSLPAPAYGRGGIGLYAEGTRPAIFDDVTVYGHMLKIDLLREKQQTRLADQISEDQEMSVWTNARQEWSYCGTTPGVWVSRTPFYGDQWLTLTLIPRAVSTDDGQLSLALATDGTKLTSGLHAEISCRPGNAGNHVALWHGQTRLVEKSVKPFTPGVEYGLRFSYAGGRLWLEIDGETVAEAPATATTGLYPMYGGLRALADTRKVTAFTRNLLDYTFAEEPVDWQCEGSWMPTVRWACAPQWSFLGGWNRGDAVLWHKQIFTGDQQFEAFSGIKMEYPRETGIYYSRYRDLGITICGDGHDPRSGYAGRYGAADAAGRPNQRAVLLRNGVEVASIPAVMPDAGSAHHAWFHLELRKQGSQVDFLVDGRKLLSYTDPEPLSAGSPAVWTTDNGICVARARIRFANTPHLRTDHPVIIAQPDYPEWVDIGTPLTLDMQKSWATSGIPVTLHATPKLLPPEASSALTIDGTQLHLAPKTVGTYWYEVRAGDGREQSTAFHLAVHAFNPRLGRDDSGALVLYRFNEGHGNIVHDLKAKNPADLPLPVAGAQWLPGGGLLLRGELGTLASAPTDKLDAIMTKRACTLELWLSTLTLDPMDHWWRGTLLAWQADGEPLTAAFCHQQGRLALLFRANDNPDWREWNACGDGYLNDNEEFRLGLHHWVVTWDGRTTTYYCDGEPLQMLNRVWQLAPAPHPRVLLGNRRENDRGYFGIYYLVAIHDHCLPPAQVKRHYLAGPNGMEAR